MLYFIVHLIFGALRSIFLVRCKHYVLFCCATYGFDHFWLLTILYNFDVKHALGTRLLQKCLRHSPPGVVCTQV
jgi:hypothetical protein